MDAYEVQSVRASYQAWPFACPQCGGELSHRGECAPLACPECGGCFTKEDGIFRLTQRTGEEYVYSLGSMTRETIRRSLRLMKSDGWSAGYRLLLEDSLPRYGHRDHGFLGHFRRVYDALGGTDIELAVQNVLDESRAGWKFLLPLTSSCVVLDIGCGFGALSISMARNAGHTFAVDASLYRLEFLQARLAEEGIDNISLICSGSEDRLPFLDNVADIVILNGVLEWVPTSRDGEPEEVQRQFLREVHRVLRPGGILYLGIENRYALPDLLGRPEGHVGLPWIGVVPRWVARAYCRAAGRGEFRLYTHSRGRLSRMITESGLDRPYFYSPFPVYRVINQLVDLERPGRMFLSIDYLQRKKLLRLCVRLVRPLLNRETTRRWLYHLLPAFSVLATKPAASESVSFVERLFHRISDELGRALPSDFEIERYLVRDQCVILLTAGTGVNWAVRLPLSDRGAKECEQNAVGCQLLMESSGIPSALRQSVPKQLLSICMERQKVYVEERLGGQPVINCILRSEYDTFLRNALGYLDAVQAATSRRQTLDHQLFAALIEEKVVTLSSHLVGSPAVPVLKRILEFLRGSLLDREVLTTWHHGDFNPGNLLANSEGCTIGVVDLTHSSEVGFPLLDVLQLIMYRYRYRDDYRFGECISRVVIPGAFSAVDRQLLEERLRRLGPSPDFYKAMVLVHWITHLHNHVGRMSFLSQRWMRANLLEPCRAVDGWLDTAESLLTVPR